MAMTAPDRYFDRVTRIDVRDDVVEAGFTHMLVDMDNTLLNRETGLVPADVRVWLGRVADAGVAVCLLSNNWHEVPYRIAGQLGLPVVAKACKPLPHGFLAARARIGARSATTVVVGDQVATDVVGAHLLGMKAYLVCPLAGNDAITAAVGRGFERVVLAGRMPEGASSAAEG